MSVKRFEVEKLIRDHLPDILRNKGIIVDEQILDQNEYIVKLKDKLQEEAKEVQHAEDENELTEELADLLEVVYALSRAAGITMEQIEKTRLAKQTAKGGFDKKIYSSYVEMEESNPSIEYYLKKPKTSRT